MLLGWLKIRSFTFQPSEQKTGIAMRSFYNKLFVQGATISLFVFFIVSCTSPEQIESITISPPSVTMKVGTNTRLTVHVLPLGMDVDVVWESSNTSVASVFNGFVSALTPGTTTIFASAGGVTAQASITVEEDIVLPPPASNGLPTIRITTPNQAAVQHRTWMEGVTFTLTDPHNPHHDISSTNPRDAIRGRGNSTWWAGVTWGKKPYRFRFRENTSLMGLPAHRNWVLLANWFDATLGTRTAFAFELGNRLGVPYTPSYHFVNLYMNGRPQGVYLLTEHRQISPTGEGAPGRPGVCPQTGWMVEFDFRWHEEDEDPKFRTRDFNLPLVIKGNDDFRPGFDYTNQDNNNFIVRQWNELTSLMACSSFPENRWRELVDMESIVNYFMVQVITNNVDFFVGHDGRPEPGSVFWHKHADGRIAGGPLWDFDLSFGYFISNTLNTNTSGWYQNNPSLRLLGSRERPYPTYPFFARFFQCPVFRVMWKESWNNNRVAIQSMGQFIDETIAFIRPDAIRNYTIWRVGQDHGQNVNFDWWATGMRSYFDRRFQFLDQTYNRVNVLPQNHNFGTITEATVVPQTITLVSFGEMTNLSARIVHDQRNNFEIISPLTLTPTGNGGFLATIEVQPNPSLTGNQSNILVLSGSNQGRNFSHEVVLSYRTN